MFASVRTVVPAVALLAVLAAVLAGPGATAPARPADEPKPAVKPAPEPAPLEVRFTDDSTLKLVLKEAHIEVTSPYGKLRVPVAEVRRIEFATRVPEEVAKRIDAAIADLGSEKFDKREAATAELLKLREKAYHALLKASKNKDPEVAKRAEELLDRVRESVPEDRLEPREFDVIHTAHSKISGRIDTAVMKATAWQFGEVQLKLPDLLALRAPGVEDEEKDAVEVLQGPINLTQLQHQVGQTFRFRVTGGVGGGAVYGTDIYTSDSNLSMAAVHAGILKPGQTGVVKVKILPAQAAFGSSNRNGITSYAYGPYPGAYKVTK